MRKVYLYTLFAAVIICLGNAGGAGLIQNRDLTGSPVSTGTCNVCHGGGNFNPDPVIELLDNGVPVTRYAPGQTYELQLTINASNFPSGFGFQMVGLDPANNSGGSFGVAPTGTRTIQINGRSYFEHAQRLAQNQFAIDWTAPASETGNISFYAVGNTVNSNGNTTGDIAATTSLTVMEDPDVASASTYIEEQITVFPVPVESYLYVDLGTLQMKYNGLHILNVQGQVVNSSLESAIDLSNIASGSYVAVIQLNDVFVAKRFIKI